jgi:Large eukaryotic DNA virus major capsid protein/Major capsid protein N-terminus
MEAVEHTLNGNPDFGRSATVTILRNGDLAGRTCLKVELNSVDLKLATKPGCDSERGKVAWVRRLGHALVKEVEVEIGGSRIDRQYGVWMDVWYELTHTSAKERGYRAMIGDVESLTKLVSINDSVNSNVATDDELPAYTLYIPLQFWFNRNPGLALPLIALQYHEVRLNFEFEDVQKLVVWSGSETPDYRQFSMANASILVDYIYLDSEERRRFAQVGHEYLIEQLQFTGVESVTGANTKLKLGFNHPCKEIIWALRNGNFNGANLKKNGNRFLAYTHDDANWANRCCDDNALQLAADNLARGMVYRPGKSVSGLSDVKAIRGPSDGSDSFCTVVKFSDGEELKVNVVVNSCVSIGASSPSLPSSSAGDWYVLEYPLANNQSDTKALVKDLGANKIKEITVSIELNSLGEWDCYGVRADSFEGLTVADISIPVGCYEYDNRATTSGGLNPYDVSVVQLSNYGLRLDGAGNPVAEANIQLNGHDRFDPLDGNYFNYVQPDAHHSRTPADGVNVYSFALHPEQHQPSGTANLSRIDNTQLNITFEDNIRKTSDLSINLFSGSLFYVWAVNYNVLRIMSGMGGLAYAN